MEKKLNESWLEVLRVTQLLELRGWAKEHRDIRSLNGARLKGWDDYNNLFNKIDDVIENMVFKSE